MYGFIIFHVFGSCEGGEGAGAKDSCEGGVGAEPEPGLLPREDREPS